MIIVCKKCKWHDAYEVISCTRAFWLSVTFCLISAAFSFRIGYRQGKLFTPEPEVIERYCKDVIHTSGLDGMPPGKYKICATDDNFITECLNDMRNANK